VTVAFLSLDDWSGVRCVMREVDQPSWDQILAAIDALDAERHTLLTLTGGGGDTLMIGGGAGRYVVIHQPGEDQFWNLHSDAPAGGLQVVLNCGGQEGDYPPDQIVGIATARAAARTLFDVGGIDAGLGWRLQDYSCPQRHFHGPSLLRQLTTTTIAVEASTTPKCSIGLRSMKTTPLAMTMTRKPATSAQPSQLQGMPAPNP
jgi:hypothetical protein